MSEIVMGKTETVKNLIIKLLDTYTFHYGGYMDYFIKSIYSDFKKLADETNKSSVEHIVRSIRVQIEGYEYKLKSSMNSMDRVITEEINGLIKIFPERNEQLNILLSNQLHYLSRYKQQMEVLRKEVMAKIIKMENALSKEGHMSKIFRSDSYDVLYEFSRIHYNYFSVEVYFSRLLEDEIHRCLKGEFLPRYTQEFDKEKNDVKKEEHLLKMGKNAVGNFKKSIEKAFS